MKRNSNTLFITSPSATTPLPWIDDAPDFSGFNQPTLSVLQKAWQDFLDSGKELEIIPDPEPVPEIPEPDFDGFVDSLAYGIGVQFPLTQAWYNSLLPVTRDPLQIAIGTQDLAAINDRLLKTMAIYPPDEATTAQVIEALIYFNIPIDLGG